MVEDTRLISTYSSAEGQAGEEKEVEILAQVLAGENVRTPGSDVKEGDLALQKGERIQSGGGEIGTLAFVGRKEVSASLTASTITDQVLG
jgi:Molybdopterin biosynthesis enzyme